MILLIDPRTSGAAGDLLIAALLDTQEKEYQDKFCNKFSNLLIEFDPNFKVNCSLINKQGFIGTQLKTSATKKFPPSEMRKIIQDLGEQLHFSSKTLNMAHKALSFLVNAEKKVHGYNSQSNNTHFHELATIDTVFDILGFFYLLDNLNLIDLEVKILPIAIGGGSIKISHGEVSVPAPATKEIIREGKLLITGGPIDGELLTPTGAALLAALNAKSILHYPLMNIQKIGCGFGTHKTDLKVLSYLQIIHGSSPSTLINEDITVLETNVDDVDGETLGYLFDILFEDDLILDLSIISTISKKNRPGYLIRAIVDPTKTLDVINIISRELGTLGVRVFSGFRHIIPRESRTYKINIMADQEIIQYKKGFIGTEKISEKIEFDDLQRLARRKGLTLREMRKIILSEIDKEEQDNA